MLSNITLTDKVYNFLKWFTLLFLPAFSAAYFSLSDIWGLPNAEKVVGTCAILATFIGALLGLSTKNFTAPVQGQIVVSYNPETDKTMYSLDLDRDPETISDMDTVSFKVVNPDGV